MIDTFMCVHAAVIKSLTKMVKGTDMKLTVMTGRYFGLGNKRTSSSTVLLGWGKNIAVINKM